MVKNWQQLFKAIYNMNKTICKQALYLFLYMMTCCSIAIILTFHVFNDREFNFAILEYPCWGIALLTSFLDSYLFLRYSSKY